MFNNPYSVPSGRDGRATDNVLLRAPSPEGWGLESGTFASLHQGAIAMLSLAGVHMFWNLLLRMTLATKAVLLSWATLKNVHSSCFLRNRTLSAVPPRQLLDLSSHLLFLLSPLSLSFCYSGFFGIFQKLKAGSVHAILNDWKALL